MDSPFDCSHRPEDSWFARTHARPISRAYLYDLIDKFIEESYKSRKDLLPVFVGLREHGASTLRANFAAMSRVALENTLRMVCHQTEVISIVHLSEAWMVKRPVGTRLNNKDLPTPSQCADREECLIAAVVAEDGRGLLMWEIERDKHGRFVRVKNREVIENGVDPKRDPEAPYLNWAFRVLDSPPDILLI